MIASLVHLYSVSFGDGACVTTCAMTAYERTMLLAQWIFFSSDQAIKLEKYLPRSVFAWVQQRGNQMNISQTHLKSAALSKCVLQIYDLASIFDYFRDKARFV